MIRGKVTAVDEASGSVTVQTEGGSFTATFAADTLKRTKVGDEVIVALEIINTRIGAIAAPVSRVEPETGNVTVETASGSLTLNFPSYAVRDLRQGDPVGAATAIEAPDPGFALARRAAKSEPEHDRSRPLGRVTERE